MPLSLFIVLLALGFLAEDPFDDVQISWAPGGSDAANNKLRIDGFGLAENENASIIYRARNEENVLTREHVRRVLDFHAFLLDYNNSRLRSTDCSATSTGRCLYIAHIAEYFQDVNGHVSFPNYSSDAELVEKLNTGRNAALSSDIRVGEVFGVPPLPPCSSTPTPSATIWSKPRASSSSTSSNRPKPSQTTFTRPSMPSWLSRETRTSPSSPGPSLSLSATSTKDL